MAKQIWSKVGNVGAVMIRDFGRCADAGDYLVQGADSDAGSNQLYGIGEDYIDECERLLSARGLTLVPDHAGLIVEARAARIAR
jgi:hypothetical protein